MPPLAYTSNLHPAESVAEICARLGDFTYPLRQRLGWDRIGIDLHLGGAAIRELRDSPGTLERLRRALDRAGAVVPTINAFPLEPFQVAEVKADAYRPDWSQAERLELTLALIAIAPQLSDEAVCSVSTLPGSHKPWGPQANDLAGFARALGIWAGAAAKAAADGHRPVVLCPEPEPWCSLETSSEIATFWRNDLANHACAAASMVLDGDLQAGAGAVAEHLAWCLDTCHVACAFEDPSAAVATATAAGAIPFKVQVSACPELRHPDAAGLAELRAMHEPRFLHQTAALDQHGTLHQVIDLDHLDELPPVAELAHVRSHFHVPLNRDELRPGVHATGAQAIAGAKAALAAGAQHVAVETYTWSILAEAPDDALAGTAAELEWLADGLAGHLPR